ncbi:MAG: septal ring lytic transglycosylase RlpA family protein [Actinomycetota bacterium]
MRPQSRTGHALIRLACCFSLLLTLTPAGALAQSTPQPVLDSAPRKIAFGKTAAIIGHLRDGTAGQEVILQQKRVGAEWHFASRKPVDSNGRVTFKRHNLRKTTVYRLRYIGAGTVTKSSEARVKVAPRLTLKIDPRQVFAGQHVQLSGRLFPVAPERRVLFQQRVDGEWRRVARVSVRDGSFSAGFDVGRKGHRRVRVRFPGDSLSPGAVTGKRITVYERDPATWYGPGLYGNTTACGQRLTSETLGVAHRSLPCGTKVSILYKGRTITVPVIDRGPYSAHADWDLTSKTAERLRFSGNDEIGTTR